ncbi:hypothetical protein RLEG12_07295 (plasmid) [Rhizobium leguminosarum bv. trifolii CB782]|nr:hypothetical protein RLEG12_07295 [Rhizobium leguminosarum bv. trifolii CB782]
MLDSLVPKAHLLRKIDAVSTSRSPAIALELYCADNGRPRLDPTLMIKALFIGYLFGIRSERQLVGSVRPKHQENRNGPDKGAETGQPVSRERPDSLRQILRPEKSYPRKNKTRRKYGGLVSSLSAHQMMRSS